jgi:hypothetical protein
MTAKTKGVCQSDAWRYLVLLLGFSRRGTSLFLVRKPFLGRIRHVGTGVNLVATAAAVDTEVVGDAAFTFLSR